MSLAVSVQRDRQTDRQQSAPQPPLSPETEHGAWEDFSFSIKGKAFTWSGLWESETPEDRFQ